MITGSDEISLKIINDLSLGKSIFQITENYSITTDQAKKLSRLHSIQKQIFQLPESLQAKFKALGLKALVLAPLVKAGDMEGLIDILQPIEPDIKRDTLSKMLPALEEKRKHIEESKAEIQWQMKILESSERTIKEKIESLHFIESQLGEIFEFLKPASEEARNFLLEHLGVKEDKIVLAKRLYYTWQQELKRDHIISYDDYSYSWQVKDINQLIAATEKKLSNSRSRKCMYFDPKVDPWNSTAEYRKVTGVDVNLKKLINDNKKEIKALEKERKELLKSIDEIKSKSAMSYMEAAVLANQLSAKDIERHALLQDCGMKWLFEQGYVCSTEFTMSNYRFDVIGYDKDNTITIIEAKASKEDFQRDNKWQNYLKYCNNFYFIFRDFEAYYIKKEILQSVMDAGAGILLVKENNRVEVMQECNYRDKSIAEADSMRFNIARACSKKLIFGY